MQRLAGGTFRMGDDRFYPGERPVREAEVDPFWIDEHSVTAGEFRRFVRATGHVTVAERELNPDDYPAADPDALVPGSSCSARLGPVDLRDVRNWWTTSPELIGEAGGKGSTINGRDRHPVVHVAYEDAEAYAQWVGKDSRRRSSGVRSARWSRGLPVRGGEVEFPAVARWPIPGRASFRGGTRSSTATKAPHRLDRFHRTAMASMTCAATSGSGRRIGSR
jgi:formylglycine-generating enzyme required for sulfatase activity